MIKISSVDKVEGHEISQIRGLQTALDSKQETGNYSTLVNGVIPSSQLPSYVDEILEYSNFENFPVTGETGKIYLAIGTRKTYRWSGSMYIEIPTSAVDSVAGKVGFVTLVISDVTGLQPALDAKQVTGNYANATHTHEMSGINGLQSALSGKQVTGNYANATHTHAISDVTGLQSALSGKQALGNYSLVGHRHNASDISGINLDLCNFSGIDTVISGDCDCDLALAIDTRVSKHLVELFNSFDPCTVSSGSQTVYTGDLCDHPGLDQSYNGMQNYNQKLLAAFDCPSYDPNNPNSPNGGACEYSIKVENKINAYIAASISEGVANCVSDQTKLGQLRSGIRGYVSGLIPNPCDILNLIPAEIQVNGPANVCGFNLCTVINDVINSTTVSQSCIDWCLVLDKIISAGCTDGTINNLFYKFIDENGNAKTTQIKNAIIEFVEKNDKDLFAKIIEPNGDTKTEIKDSIIEFIDRNKNDIVYKIIDANGNVTQEIKDRLERYIKENRNGIFNQIISATGSTTPEIRDSIVEFVDDNQDQILSPMFATSLTNPNPPLFQKIGAKRDEIFAKFIDQAGTTSNLIKNSIKAFVGANGPALLNQVFYTSDTGGTINGGSLAVLGQVVMEAVIPMLRANVLFSNTIAIVPNLNSITPSNAQDIATAAKLLIAETGIKILDSFQFKGEYGAEGLKFSNQSNDYVGEMGSTGLRIKYQDKKVEIVDDAIAITNPDGNVSIAPSVLHMTGAGGGGGEIIMDVSALQGKTARFRPLRICTGGQTETVYVLMATSSSN